MMFAMSVLLLLILYPTEAKTGAISGLRLCANAVIPSLFPFFVTTRLLTARLPKLSFHTLERFLGMNSDIVLSFLISLIGGYPIGVASIVSLYDEGRIKKHEAEQSILFCNNSGPGFFVGMVGASVLGSIKSGLILYGFHVLSAIVCAFLLSERSGKRVRISRTKSVAERLPQSFSNAITSSCTSILQICALVVFFSVLATLLQKVGLLSLFPKNLQALICGSLELTSGIAMLNGQDNTFILCAFLMGWGGICVHMQAICIWQKFDLHPKGYFIAKLTHGLISAVFALSYRLGTHFFVLCLSLTISLCIIFTLFRQIWGSKKRKLVV